jgi:hypothetical protein
VALSDFLLKPFESLWDRLFGGTVVARLVSKITDGAKHVGTLFSRIQHLIDSVKSEIEAFSHWKEDIRFKSRVINVPAAASKIGELIQGLRESWKAILDLVHEFEATLKGGIDPEQEATQLAEDIGELDNVGESLLKRFPKLAKGLEKLLGIVTAFVDAIIQWSDAVDKLQTIVDEVTRIREAIESGEQLFLSQNNKRKSLALADGKVINIRLGKLHHS